MNSSSSSKDIVECVVKLLFKRVMKYTQNTKSCMNCPRKFKDLIKLEAHVESKHTLFKCNVCEDEFSKVCTLKKHGRLHTKKKIQEKQTKHRKNCEKLP